ncbi:Hypothetical predicted protein [Olea europaea subsp. europaea]|uniref:Uncharacterized protein n=1 Tax=Olea europaea subsp. europaea TaxID=158383 RepID=A0A8S0S1M3_OLEEU|nr:Hypothetical predicted protein [Olea europaea subsp. europaea]
MGSKPKVSYQRLRSELWFDEDGDYHDIDIREKVIRRFRSRRFRKVHIRRKLRIKIPSLKRLLRRKARLVKIGWCKILKRLKESQSHFGDLFAGNYMFMQVTPTPLKSADISVNNDTIKYFEADMQLEYPGTASELS